VVQAAAVFATPNHAVLDNPEVSVEQIDGFKFFAHHEGNLDIVISEPSVLWSVGVEKLFTPEYYRLVERALADDGVFTQWIPAYDLHPNQFRTILSNLLSVFPHLRLYAISKNDFGILASSSPLPQAADPERFAEPALQESLRRMALLHPDQLVLATLHETHALRYWVATGETEPHTLNHPTLAYRADRQRFLGEGLDVTSFLDNRLLRVARRDGPASAAFRNVNNSFPDGIRCVEPYSGIELFCDRFNELQKAYRFVLYGLGHVEARERVAAYDDLRLAGVVEPMPGFLGGLLDAVLADEAEPDFPALLDAVFRAYVMDGAFDEAQRNLERLWQGGKIPEPYYRKLLADIGRSRKGYAEFLARYLATPGFEQAD
jgi:hypothetical protein